MSGTPHVASSSRRDHVVPEVPVHHVPATMRAVVRSDVRVVAAGGARR